MMGSRGLIDSPCPQAVLIHHPWLVYPESPAWGRCTPRDYLYRRIRNAFFARGLQYADVVAAQTPVMAERIHRHCRIPLDRIALIPNSVTSTADESPAESESSTRIRATPHAVRGLCLTRYYTHKNLEVLLEVADTLLERGRTEIGLFLTVAPTHGARRDVSSASWDAASGAASFTTSARSRCNRSLPATRPATPSSCHP